MIYYISKTELGRRKKAYISLSISLLIGLLSGSIILNFPIPLVIYAFVVIALSLIGIFSFSFFRILITTQITLTPKSLQRRVGNTFEEYMFSNIQKIEIKSTTNKTTREIYIRMNGQKTIIITALHQFEKFRNDLLNKVGNISIHKILEPMDFDHPLFYPVLGLLIGNISMYLFRFLTYLNLQQIKIWLYFLLTYLFVLGFYFFISKPISKRSGNKTYYQDYVLGGVLIVVGIILWVYIFHLFQE